MNKQETEQLKQIITSFHNEVIRELKAIRFNKQEAAIIVNSYSMPLLNVLKKSFDTGFRSGKLHHKQHIDEGIERIILKWSGINLRVGSSEVLEALQDIKKLNK